MIVKPKSKTYEVRWLLDRFGLLEEVEAAEESSGRPLAVLCGYTEKGPGYSGDELGLAVPSMSVVYVPRVLRHASLKTFVHEIIHYLDPDLTEGGVRERTSVTLRNAG